jgi:hypothetical protein
LEWRLILADRRHAIKASGRRVDWRQPVSKCNVA